MAKQASKSANIKQNNLIHIVRPPPPLGLIHFFKINNINIKELSQYRFNKDHQRMMVDPMFIIVQSLRSFPTAVTPTVVVPIAVILPVFT